jgi:hypothetical protein
VCLLAEVEMGSEGVLGEVHGEIAGEDERWRCRPAPRKSGGEELYHRNGKHESGSESQEMLDDFQLERRTSSYGECPQHVAERRYESIQERLRHE